VIQLYDTLRAITDYRLVRSQCCGDPGLKGAFIELAQRQDVHAEIIWLLCTEEARRQIYGKALRLLAKDAGVILVLRTLKV
jgi:hypothetical protein